MKNCISTQLLEKQRFGIIKWAFESYLGMKVYNNANYMVILDKFCPKKFFKLPDVDGYTLLQQIRSLPAEKGGLIPAIALSAYAGEMDHQRALAVGFQQHITKPIEPNRLAQAVVELLKSKK